MLICYECGRPIRHWERRVRLKNGNLIHRACGRGLGLGLVFVRAQIAETIRLQQITSLQSLPHQSKSLTDYEVEIVDIGSRGLILIWDFGWASRRYGDMCVKTDPLPPDVGGNSTHHLGDASIEPLPSDARRESLKNEPIVLLPQWEISGWHGSDQETDYH